MIIKKQSMKVLLSTLLITSAMQSAYAEVKVNGFASVRAGQMISTDGDNPLLPNLYNDDELTFDDESLFALQFSSDLGDGLSATVQLMSEGSNDWDIDARWAYLAYEINDQHTIKAGRIANPLFYNSEYEKVGYAHNYSRLPKSVYWGYDFSTINGMSLDSNYEFGDYYLRTKLMYGSWDGEVYQSTNNEYYDMKIENAVAVNFDLNKDWWTIFGGFSVSEIDNPEVDASINAIYDPIIAASGASQQEADYFRSVMSQTGDGQYMYGGFKIDYNNWLIDAEVAEFGVKDTSDAINTNWYFSVGRRFGDYVVTVHHEEFTQDADYDQLNGVTNPVLIQAGQQGLETFASSNIKMDVVSLRWDFHPSAALKADYFMGTEEKENVGDFSGFSVGVDFVF